MIPPISLLSAAMTSIVPSPVALQDQLLLDASPAVRAATVNGVEPLLDRPRHYRFGCELNELMGAPRRCVPAVDLSEPITWSEFFRRAENTGTGDVLENRALERAKSIRFRPVPDLQQRRLVLIDVVLSRQDALPALPPAQTLAVADVTFESVPGPVPASSLYPEAALREEIWADVEVTCRITSVRNLLCRDARVVGTGDSEHRYDRAFIMATCQLSSMQKIAPSGRDGQDVRGKDMLWRVSWRTPSI